MTPKKPNKDKLRINDLMDLTFRFLGAYFEDEDGVREEQEPSGYLEINGVKVGFQSVRITKKKDWIRPMIEINFDMEED